MVEIEFFIPMKKVPTTTHQQKGVRVIKKGGKNIPMFYDTDAIKEARLLFRNGCAPYAPLVPLKPPIRMTTKWLHKKRKNDKSGIYKTTRPDNDNSVKLLQDEMEKLGFFDDDAHIGSSVTEKFYSDTVGIYIHLQELED